MGLVLLQCDAKTTADRTFQQLQQSPVKLGWLGSGCSVSTAITALWTQLYNLTEVRCTGFALLPRYLRMCQRRGNEVTERQGKGNKSTKPRTAPSFEGKKEALPWVGFEPTILLSKRVLYQLSYI